MVKKIVFIILISLLISSCGKKGCPKFNEADKCNDQLKQIT
tara:strand:- start:317 stop:439 length:123 start_codon:yes stop_codon:yes gene_type:complete